MIESVRSNQVFVVGSVYTDGDIGIAGVYTNEEDPLNLRDRMDDRRFLGDGIKFNFQTHAPLYTRNEK